MTTAGDAALCLALLAACGNASSPTSEVVPAVESVALLVSAPGRGAAQIDGDLAGPVLGALRGQPGVAHVETMAREGMMRVAIELAPGTEPPRVRQALSSRVSAAVLAGDALAELAVADAPTERMVLVTSPDRGGGSVLRAAGDSNGAAEALARVPGIVAVRTCGAPNHGVLVTVDPAQLTARAVAIDDVVRALSRPREDPARRVDLGPGENPSLESALRDAIAHAEGGLGALLHATVRESPRVEVMDVAHVGWEVRGRECSAQLDGAFVDVAGARAPPGDEALFRASVANTLRSTDARELRASGPPFVLELPAGASDGDAREAAFRAFERLRVVPGVARVLVRAGEWDDAADGPGVVVVQIEAGDGGPTGAALAAQLRGLPGVALRLPGPLERTLRVAAEDPEVLARTADALVAALRALPAVAAASARDAARVPRVVVEVDGARAAEAGIREAAVRQAFAAATDGLPAGELLEDGRPYPVRVVLGDPPPDDPTRVVVQTPRGPLPIAALASVRQTTEPLLVARRDGRRFARVRLSLANEASWPDVRALLARESLPPGVALELP